MPDNIYHFQIGAIPAIVFASAREPLTEALVASIFTQDVERMTAAWRSQLELAEFCQNILYLETGGERILIDTGEGENVPDKPGQLLNLLRAEGIDPASIDTIIPTHFHIDHLGGLLDAQGDVIFPNARLLTLQAEYDYYMHEDVLATLKPPRPQILRATFAAYPPEFVEVGDEIASGVRLIDAPGHTPGHVAVLIESEGERLLHIVDAAHMTLQLNAPDAVPRFDVQPETAVAIRTNLFDLAEREQILMMGYHFPFPGLGYIQGDGIGQRIWTRYRNREDMPDYLLETYDMLACAYPYRIPEEDYRSVMALIHPYMSFWTIADVLSALTHNDRTLVYNDASGFGLDPLPSDEDIARVKQKLDACGYQEWIAKDG